MGLLLIFLVIIFLYLNMNVSGYTPNRFRLPIKSINTNTIINNLGLGKTKTSTMTNADPCAVFNDNAGGTNVEACKARPGCRPVTTVISGARRCLNDAKVRSAPAGIYRDIDVPSSSSFMTDVTPTVATSSFMTDVTPTVATSSFMTDVTPTVATSSFMTNVQDPCASFNDNAGGTNVEACRARADCVPVVPPFSSAQRCYEKSDSNLSNPALKDSFRYL